jgi:hypothetical protein
MKVSSAFPSNYIKCADLQGRSVRVKINYIKMEDIGDDNKPVLYFIGKEKGLVLNKTNANVISMLYGDETDDWPGCEIEMYPTETDFQGKRVDAIRVRKPTKQLDQGDRIAPNARARQEQQDSPSPPLHDNSGAFDDEIPC